MASIQDKKYLILIAGPTAVGKTELAIEIAQFFKTEIVSADSRQFFREMNIGTAKPTNQELAKVKHYFINNKSVSEEYTSGMYEADALEVLKKLFEIHDIVVLTGGSGLYIKALCEGMDEMPDVPLEIRECLNEAFLQNGLNPLLAELQKKDAVYFSEVDRNNHVRVIRALEVIRASGKPYSYFRTAKKKGRFFETIKIGLNRERSELYERIDERMDAMLKQGLIDEVKGLYAYKDRNALQTLGYTEVFGFLDNHYDFEEMVRLLKQNSRRYAKRQLTWFGKDKEIQWFHPNQKEAIFKYIDDFIKKASI